MTLEKNKVYKCVHTRTHMEEAFPRDYIIFSPREDTTFDEELLFGRPLSTLKAVCKIRCIFLIDFCGEPSTYDVTTVFRDCHFEELTNKDLDDIRMALGSNFKYNRRLNALIPIEG